MSKFASLTAGLLARKGEAEPVVTPFADRLPTRVGAPDAPADVRMLTPPRVHRYVEPGAVSKPQAPKIPGEVASPVFGAFGRRSAQQLAAESVHAHEDDDPAGANCGVCAVQPADEAAKSYHVNLRMKRPRFVKLKLSSALLRKPVQEIVAEALDAWFDRLPPDVLGDCACMKGRGD